MNLDDRYPLISLITINYNQLKITAEFIESTKNLTYPNYEIIVVDNNSSKDPSEYLRSLNPQIKVIRSEQNLGFSGGNNVGIKAAKGEYFFIVNNDTEVTPHLLHKLLEPFELDSSIGVVSPKIRYFSDPNIIQYAGFSSINPYTGRNKTIGYKQEDVGQFDTPGYTAYAHGAAMLVKREIVEKVGFLPEIFFIYYEELDWSANIHKAGYKIYYQPEALIYHKESMTMGKESLMKTYYFNRNRILFMRRHASPFQFLCFAIFFLVGILPTKVIRYAARLQFRHMFYFFKAMVWHLWHFKFDQYNNNYYIRPYLTPAQN
jgi:GT2 family glycosyltransferase